MNAGFPNTDPSSGALPSQWDANHRRMKIQVYGCGLVGREIAGLLLHLGHPVRNLTVFATQARSLRLEGHEVHVQRASREVPGADVAFLCTPPDVALRITPLLTSLGTRVIDLSGAHRGRRDVPLAAPGIGLEAIGAFTDLVALPGRSASVIAPAIWVLERFFGWKELSITVLLSVVAEGAQGLLDLQAESDSQTVPGRRRANLVPGPPPGSPGHRLDAEPEILADLRQLLGRNDLPFDVQIVRTGLERCDGFVVQGLFRRPPGQGEVVAALTQLSCVTLEGGQDGASADQALGSGTVHVGRIRAGSRGPASLCFFAVGDQLRFGAAVAALEVAARLPVVA